MSAQPYTILPFWFKRYHGAGLLMVNECGEYHFIDYADFDALISYKLPAKSTNMLDLKSKHFVSGQDIDQTIEMTATKHRTRKMFLNNFTSLHMMVITLRCNHRCEYCQVSCEDQDAHKYDMSSAVAKKVVDCIFQSPAPAIKIEFQGGEPLLNWSAITTTVEYAETINKTAGKYLEFVICTNLTLINSDQLDFIKSHGISISTSLDGPQGLHDSNRKLRIGESSYLAFLDKLKMTQEVLGADRVNALMTFTSNSIGRVTDIIDEYVRLGFSGLFLRSINPYGFAAKNVASLGYPMSEFVSAYREALHYIVKLNLEGTRFIEYYTTLLLTRILTPFPTGFVDLQSPSGAGIAGAIYDYNGDVYPADEARMLSRMGDSKFLMGNVFNNTYHDIFMGDIIQDLVKKSCLEIMPGCSSCVYRPYCGADPVRNYLEYKDAVGKRPGSPSCIKHTGIFDLLFGQLRQNDQPTMDVFWAWITNREVGEVSLA